MNKEEREAFKEELIDDLCGNGFRAELDPLTGKPQIVVNDIIEACLPAILNRIDSENSKIPSKRPRKKINLKGRAFEAFEAGFEVSAEGWNGETLRESDSFGAPEYQTYLNKKFEEWWEQQK